MAQKLWIWMCSILVIMTICNSTSRSIQPIITKCEFYNDTLCEFSRGMYGCGNTVQACHSVDYNTPSYCYAFWINNTRTNQLAIKFKGCFLNNMQCHGQRQCKDKKEEINPNGFMFCCCEGDFCNSELLWDPVPTTP